MTAPRTLAHIRAHRPPLETPMTNSTELTLDGAVTYPGGAMRWQPTDHNPAADDGLPTVEKLRRANADLQRSLNDAYITIRSQAAELRARDARRPFDTARRVAAWLATTNGTGRDQQTLQILKVTEEAGEVASAWIGTVGQNPRKGVTHTTDDVAGELADVVLSALVAIAGLGLDPEQVVGDCIAKVAQRLDAAEVPA